ncbi:hypothetical protein Tsp_10289 [Trichinella spiralis]|uniref:hypothetical protein n=1 Tax=Trichinella spiralis TaxID=6334 RepID=UPI0001EFE1C1|nr:hypothetical protein Tsp_10289 [Trichinella spiralis]
MSCLQSHQDAFLQMPVDEKSQKYLTTHIGYFQYKKLPFGITAAPAIYKRYMESLLATVANAGIYLDDVIITGENKITCLKHRIDGDGIHPTMERVEAIAETTSRKNVKERRTFLGAELVTQKSSLVPYDPKVPLVFTCDASERGLGAGLFERFLDGTEKPIAFAPQTPSGAKNRTEIPSVRVWKTIFVNDRPPSVGTNISQKTQFKKIINNRLKRWKLDYKIEYRKGKQNYCADALSRLPMQTEEPYTVVNREIKRINMTKLDDLWLSEKEKFEEEHKKRY